MTRFVAKFVLMGLLLIGTDLAIGLLPAKSYLVYASLLDKHARLEATAAPRVIFVGGSGIALGLDSALVETELGLPVINMGVNAGFGLRYMLAEVTPYLQPGDIVAVVPEYEHFYGQLLEGDQNLLWAVRVRPSSIAYLRPAQIWHLLPEVPRFVQLRVLEQLRPRPDPIYNRSAFNSHGDFVSHLDLPAQTPELYDVSVEPRINLDAITTLKQFATTVQAKGATMILIYPAVSASFWDYHNNAALISQLHAQLSAQPELVLLGEPEKFVLPATMFFDTVYHLASRGRAQRSAQLATQINTFIHDPRTIVHAATR